MENRIVIHSSAQAETALAAAAEAGCAVTLVSPPRAAAYLGAAVFREMMAAALGEHPNVNAKTVLDCGEDAGHALNALRQGLKSIRIDLSGEVRRRIADIARQYGAELDNGNDPALDLAMAPDPAAACRDWMSSRSEKRHG